MSAVGRLVGDVLALRRPLLLAWDVDGTLAPIVDDPTQARVPAAVETALRVLSEVPSVHVALISGRDLDGLVAMVDIPRAYIAVEHGSVVFPPGERSLAPRLSADDTQRLSQFETWARKKALPLGAQLEAKRSSRGLHVRTLLKKDAAVANRLLEEAAEAAIRCGLLPRTGRAVLEAELARGDKAAALRNIAAECGAEGIFFAGDDLTDLPAIEQAVDAGGVGVFVCSPERPDPPDRCSVALSGPSDIEGLIAGLAQHMAGQV